MTFTIQLIDYRLLTAISSFALRRPYRTIHTAIRCVQVVEMASIIWEEVRRSNQLLLLVDFIKSSQINPQSCCASCAKRNIASRIKSFGRPPTIVLTIAVSVVNCLKMLSHVRHAGVAWVFICFLHPLRIEYLLICYVIHTAPLPSWVCSFLLECPHCLDEM